MNKVEFGDCRDTMRAWVKQGVQVQTCVTSPPYFGLRDYGHDGQIGLEQRAPEYIESLIEVFQCVAQLLANDGVLFVVIGDTYAGFKDGKFSAESIKNDTFGGLPTGIAPHRCKNLLTLDGFKNKELMGIPWRFALAMQDSGWYLRQDIIWSKPNYRPEGVRDRFVRSHEHVFMFTKSDKYYLDSDAVRIPNATGGSKLRNDVWTIPVTPYKGAHFATFPIALVKPCILAASRLNDVVLDPFIGSCTTAECAAMLGRQYLGCELNEDYRPLLDARLDNAVGALFR